MTLVTAAATAGLDELLAAAGQGTSAVAGLFSSLLNGDDNRQQAAGAIGADGVSAAVQDVLIGQQALVPMGMDDKGHISDTEQEAMDMLKDMTEGGLNGYWKWMMKQLREQVMSEMGITEEALAAMDPTQRAAVEQAIADEVEKRLTEAMAKNQQEGGPINLGTNDADGESVQAAGKKDEATAV